MNDKIAFDLVSPERLLVSADATMVTVPGADGEMGVMAGHEPLISTLRPGVIEVRGASGGQERYFVSGGFAEVTPAKITVLAEDAVPLATLDAAALDQRILDAEEDVAIAKTDAEISKATQTLAHLRRLRTAL
jgi:F-type H+-transporting ATPase subunit epsilon